MQKISWQEKVKFEIQVELNRLITGAFTCNANWVKWDGEVWSVRCEVQWGLDGFLREKIIYFCSDFEYFE